MTPDPHDSKSVTAEELTAAPSSQRSERFAAIGRQLQTGREAQGLSRSEVARALNLPTHLLDDLESGRMERLAPLYRRGYINNYAALLGADAEQLLADLQQDEPPQLKEVLKVKRPRFRFDRYMKLATYLIVTIAIVPPLFYVYLNTGARLFQPDAGVEQATTQRVSIPASQGGTAGTQSETAPGLDRQPVNASTLPLGPIRPMSDAPTPSRDPIAEAPLPSEAAEVVPDIVELEIVVRLKEDSWVEITAGDSQRLEYDLLRSDQERVYRGQPPFDILLGRASAVELLLDGVPLTFEGHDRGDVAQLRVDVDGASLH